MPIHIIRQDITKMQVDAIVNAANRSLLGGGGVDGAIHRAAGPALLEECRRLHGCETGDAKITGAGRLPCKYVIHTVGPVWHGGAHNEEALLTSCYERSLELALGKGCRSVAFPLISSGAYGYPKDQALRVADDTIRRFLGSSGADMDVYIVVFDRAAFRISSDLYADLRQYIDDRYTLEYETHEQFRSYGLDDVPLSPQARPVPASDEPVDGFGLQDVLVDLEDKGFSERLMDLIDESGMTDAQCYRKANVDRRLFSKIRCNPDYQPSKSTALSFALALELSLERTRELLESAGYALSHASKSDIIVEYYIQHGEYDVLKINEALFAFDQQPLSTVR